MKLEKKRKIGKEKRNIKQKRVSHVQKIRKENKIKQIKEKEIKKKEKK